MRSLPVFDSLIVCVLVCFCWFPSASSQADPETQSHQIHLFFVSRWDMFKLSLFFRSTAHPHPRCTFTICTPHCLERGDCTPVLDFFKTGFAENIEIYIYICTPYPFKIYCRTYILFQCIFFNLIES